jgi:hypothetical protein
MEANMTQTEIEQILIELIKKIQSMSGRPGAEISPSTRPIVDLEEFDSLNGVELTVEVADRIKFDPDFNNILLADDKPLSIAEAAQRLLGQMQLKTTVE